MDPGRGWCRSGPGQVAPVAGDAERGQGLALGGEVLGEGRAPGVAQARCRDQQPYRSRSAISVDFPAGTTAYLAGLQVPPRGLAGRGQAPGGRSATRSPLPRSPLSRRPRPVAPAGNPVRRWPPGVVPGARRDRLAEPAPRRSCPGRRRHRVRDGPVHRQGLAEFLVGTVAPPMTWMATTACAAVTAAISGSATRIPDERSMITAVLIKIRAQVRSCSRGDRSHAHVDVAHICAGKLVTVIIEGIRLPDPARRGRTRHQTPPRHHICPAQFPGRPQPTALPFCGGRALGEQNSKQAEKAACHIPADERIARVHAQPVWRRIPPGVARPR